MAKKKNENPAKYKLEFIDETEIPDEVLDAEASLMLNPYVRWAKFIMTDDQPNGNMERTPVEEFDNIIQSGIHMPIKMGEGRIEEGHEASSPIGVITHLQKEFIDGINRIVGLAAFWLRERPSDVTFIKDLVDSGEDVNLSWELGAQDKVLAEDGIYDWRGLATQAVTIVKRPAYQGRTRIIAMAAKKKPVEQVQKWGKDYVENLPDSHFLYVERGGEKDSEGRTYPRELRHFPVKDDKGLYDESKLREALVEAGKSNIPTPALKSLKKTVVALLERVDAGASLEEVSFGEGSVALENIVLEDNTVELDELKKRVSELEAELATAKASLQEKEQAFASIDEAKKAMETELAELKAFKEGIDAEAAKAEKLSGIKAKFAEAKLNKDEAYFTENSEKLLSLDEASVDFMVQELAAFSAQASLEDDGKETKTRIPNLPGEPVEVSVSEIVKALRERKNSK